ncbi:MAG: hypothetical protein AAB353_13970 [Candidatus Hydrogenedentota bacterium]
MHTIPRIVSGVAGAGRIVPEWESAVGERPVSPDGQQVAVVVLISEDMFF